MAPSEIKTPPLNIAIVGAGIGGLSAAIALRKEGHDVVLFEQSQFTNKIGAAINLCPNGNRALRNLGLYSENFGANVCEYLSEYDPHDLQERYSWDTHTVRGEFSSPWNLVHRVDLHTALKIHALDNTALPGTAELRLSYGVAGIDIPSCTLELHNGSTFTADVIIAADGAQSKLRDVVLGEPCPATPSGLSVYRSLIPRELIEDDPRTEWFLRRRGELSVYVAGDLRIVTYPCRDNTILNVVAIHPDRLSEEVEDSWHARGSKANLLRVFQEFHPKILALLKKCDAEKIGLWRLLDRSTLPKWMEGSVALVGDAAHPFLPQNAQGASQALEDAVSLGVFLHRGTKPEDVPARLKLYEEIRKDRVTTLQNRSRVHAKGPEKGQLWNDGIAERWRETFVHDAYEESRRFLQLRSGGRIDLKES